MQISQIIGKKTQKYLIIKKGQKIQLIITHFNFISILPVNQRFNDTKKCLKLHNFPTPFLPIPRNGMIDILTSTRYHLTDIAKQ